MATQYVVRDTAGSVRNGTFPEGDPTTIYVSFSRDVSLNLGAEDIATYTRNGENLLVMLQNGEVLVLDGYFEENATGPKNLFLSEEGEIVEVFLGEANEGTIVPTYASLDVGGKWSAYDDMVFLDLDRIEPVVAPLAAPVFGGLGWLGAGGAALAATALVGGDDTDDGDNGGDDTGTTVTPTVDDPDSTQTIGGTQADAPVVTGTGVPGSTIQVTVNDKTVTTTVGGDGTWTATFDPGDLPSDGVWEAVVVGPDSNGTSITLDGPTMDIDTTPPVVNVTDGTQSTGDFVNAVTQASGTVITGTGEAGATLAVTVAGTTHTTTVDANGDWSVTFATSEISTGEYTTGISITSTDARGNATTVTDTLVVDTETVVAVDSGQAGGDDVINQAELAADVTLTGTAEAGASVQVTVQGVTRTATVDANGNWSAVFEAGSLPTGEYNTTITAVSTDAYGNSATSSAAIRVDT
ncbi:MAG: Ig-like domain-containing protein, partial [Pseudomonadota bacterium]